MPSVPFRSDDSGGRLRGAARISAGVLVLCLLPLGLAMAFPNLVARHVVPLFLYVPGRLPASAADPAAHGLEGGRQLRVEAEDGMALHAWWIPARTTRCGSVVFFHGNAGTIADRAFLADRFSRKGYDVLLPEYRGYGRSEGTPSENGLYRDGMAAYRHTREDLGVPADELVVVGHSLGGAVAAHVAAEAPAAGTALTGAFATLPGLARRRHGWLPDAVFRGWTENLFDVHARVRRIEGPVFVARGGLDAVIPRGQTRSLYEAAGVERRWYEAPAAGHNDLWGDDRFWRELDGFLRDVLGCSPGAPPPGAG